MELVACPGWDDKKNRRCNQPAEITDQYEVESTNGSAVLVAIACAANRSHLFHLPLAKLIQDEAA